MQWLSTPPPQEILEAVLKSNYITDKLNYLEEKITRAFDEEQSVITFKEFAFKSVDEFADFSRNLQNENYKNLVLSPSPH